MDALFLPLLALCVLAVASALAVVLVGRPVHAVVALLAHSLSLAVIYAVLSAGMVAVGQLLIYSGAIVVLFLFVVTLLPMGGTELRPAAGRIIAALVAAATLIAALAAALTGVLPTPSAAPVGLTITDVGVALFQPLLVALEFTSPLLLVAIVGAVAIWRRRESHPVTAVRPTSTGVRRVVLHR